MEIKQVSEQQHMEDHQLIEQVRPMLFEFLEDQRKRREMRERFRQSFVGAVAVAVVTGIGSALVWIGGVVINALQSGRHP